MSTFKLEYLGLRANHPDIQNLLAESGRKEEPTIAPGDIEARYGIKEKGYDLLFDSEDTLFKKTSGDRTLVFSSITFLSAEYSKYGYVPYGASLPLGIRFDMKRDELSVILGAPVKTWEKDNFIRSQRWVIQGKEILIQYVRGKETIAAVNCSLPKEV